MAFIFAIEKIGGVMVGNFDWVEPWLDMVKSKVVPPGILLYTCTSLYKSLTSQQNRQCKCNDDVTPKQIKHSEEIKISHAKLYVLKKYSVDRFVEILHCVRL